MASYDKINYLLRPSKQVERKLLIEGLLKLSSAGYYINEYTYLGLGSIYFADFILFHKYLFINEMICAEKEDIPNRMEFNKPYKFIELHMKPISDVIPTINRDKPHLVWLDYDSILTQDELSDIRSCMHILPERSIFLITIPADKRNLNDLLDPIESKKLNEEQNREKILESLNNLLSEFNRSKIKSKDLSSNNLPLLYSRSLINFINVQLNKRNNIKFYQLFNFKYADNLQMLTIGGIIDTEEMEEKIESSGIYELDFISKTENLIEISIDPMTIREKMWFEKHYIKNPESIPTIIEVKKELIENFKKYYRYYPSYYEALI